MVSISIAIIVSTLIGSVAYVLPKIVFLNMQGNIVDRQVEAQEQARADIEAMFDDGTVASSDGSPYL